MSRWKDIARRVALRIEDELELRKLGLTKGESPRPEDIAIVPYRSFGDSTSLHVRGRVLRDRNISAASEHEPVWRNMVNVYKRLASDEIAGARLVARFRGDEVEGTSDEEGYFHFQIPVALDASHHGWHEVELRLDDDREGEPAIAYVLVPSEDAEYGIISDLDDTVVQTGATALTSMVRTVLLHNAHTRIPFEGVSAFYRALHRGNMGEELNPIFYVSSGPWNLYDLYADFLAHQSIPAGPIMLGDYGIDEEKFIHDPHDEHKLRAVRGILNAYPRLRFVLIGDSGQRDPEIYSEVVRQFPGRVAVIYIRDVTVPERDAVVHSLRESLLEAGGEMVLVQSSLEAAEDAVQRGLIPADAIPSIAQEKARDEQEDSETLLERS